MTEMIKLPLEKCFQGLSNIVKNVPFGQTLPPTKFTGSLAPKVVIVVTLMWTFHSLTMRWWEPCMEDHKLYEWRRVARSFSFNYGALFEYHNYIMEKRFNFFLYKK